MNLHHATILLYLCLSPALAATKLPENSVHEVGGWILITTYSGEDKPFPEVWALPKDSIQSVDFAATRDVRSGKSRKVVIRRYVRIRITTLELVATDTGVAHKEYVSRWIDIRQATQLVGQIVEAIARNSTSEPTVPEEPLEGTTPEDRLPAPSAPTEALTPEPKGQ